VAKLAGLRHQSGRNQGDSKPKFFMPKPYRSATRRASKTSFKVLSLRLPEYDLRESGDSSAPPAGSPVSSKTASERLGKVARVGNETAAACRIKFWLMLAAQSDLRGDVASQRLASILRAGRPFLGLVWRPLKKDAPQRLWLADADSPRRAYSKLSFEALFQTRCKQDQPPSRVAAAKR
jgi:hypothetical protein